MQLRVRQGVLELAGETALGLSLLDPFIYSHKVQEIQEKRDAVGHKEQEKQERRDEVGHKEQEKQERWDEVAQAFLTRT